MLASESHWCLGLPRGESSPLDQHERDRLWSLFEHQNRIGKRYRWFYRSVVGVALAVIPVWTVVAVLGTEEFNPGLTVFSAIGVVLIWAAFLGGLGEILFGFSRISRLVFIFALLIPAGTLWIDHPWATGLGLAGLSVAFYGGGAMLFLRGRDLKRCTRDLERLRTDLVDGTAWVFGSQGPAGSPPQTTEEGSSPPEARRPQARSIRLCPRSRVLVRLDGQLVDDISILPVTTHATDGVEHLTAPLADACCTHSDPDISLRQRHLSTGERRELAQLVTRSLWSQLAWLLVSGLFLTRSVMFLCQHLFGLEAEYAGAIAMTAILSIVVLLALSIIWERWQLHRDRKEGLVTVLASVSDDVGNEQREEWLPNSGCLWTHRSAPADWRQHDTTPVAADDHSCD